MDWLDLLAAQGTLKSLLQHPSSKHQFFGTQSSLWAFFFPYQHSNTTLEFFTTPAGVCATYCFSPQISKCSHTSSWALLKFSQEDPSGLPIKNYVISIPPPTYLPSYLLFQLNFFDLKNYLFIFNWLMIGLQYWFDFCHTSTWNNHRDICGWISLPPPAHSHLSRLL